MPTEPNAKEIAALDAIIAASLAGRAIEDLNDDEILKLCDSSLPLSESGKAILDRLGSEPFQIEQSARESHLTAEKAHFAGMYREGSDEGLEPEVKEEIDRKREELRARLRAKKKDV